MNRCLEPAGHTNTHKEAALDRHTMLHANHTSVAAGVSGIHNVVATETASEGCGMLPSSSPYRPKKGVAMVVKSKALEELVQ